MNYNLNQNGNSITNFQETWIKLNEAKIALETAQKSILENCVHGRNYLDQDEYMIDRNKLSDIFLEFSISINKLQEELEDKMFRK